MCGVSALAASALLLLPAEPPACPPACLPATPCLCRYGAVVQAKLFTAPGFNNDFQFGFVEMSCAAEAECAHAALQASPGGPASSCH